MSHQPSCLCLRELTLTETCNRWSPDITNYFVYYTVILFSVSVFQLSSTAEWLLHHQRSLRKWFSKRIFRESVGVCPRGKGKDHSDRTVKTGKRNCKVDRTRKLATQNICTVWGWVSRLRCHLSGKGLHLLASWFPRLHACRCLQRFLATRSMLQVPGRARSQTVTETAAAIDIVFAAGCIGTKKHDEKVCRFGYGHRCGCNILCVEVVRQVLKIEMNCRDWGLSNATDTFAVLTFSLASDRSFVLL